MITMPLSVLLVLFGLFMVVFLTFIAINIRDIIMSHAVNGTTFFMTILILMLSVSTLMIGWQLLGRIDWDAQIPLLDRRGFSSSESTPL